LAVAAWEGRRRLTPGSNIVLPAEQPRKVGWLTIRASENLATMIRADLMN
jgi:hypothetical protein